MARRGALACWTHELEMADEEGAPAAAGEGIRRDRYTGGRNANHEYEGNGTLS